MVLNKETVWLFTNIYNKKQNTRPRDKEQKLCQRNKKNKTGRN